MQVPGGMPMPTEFETQGWSLGLTRSSSNLEARLKFGKPQSRMNGVRGRDWKKVLDQT